MKKGSPQNQKYRIAHLQLLPLLSGVQRVTLEEVTRLDPTRFEPTVICKEEGPLTEALKTRGIPYFCVPELVREISPLQDLKALIRLKRLFSEGQFDIVHTHSSKTGILGRLAGKWAGVPIVMHTVHGFAFPAAKNLFEKSLYYGLEWLGARLTDALVVLNRHDFSLALKKLRVAKDMIFLMPNGVDTSVFLKPEENVRNKVRSEVFQVRRNQMAIGTVGRLSRQKNPESFVKVAIDLLQSGLKNVSFFLIGDGEEKGDIEDLIQKSGFATKIKILGWREDVGRLMGGLDIFTLPSRWEGMPLVVLEAMATGLPVVVSDIPGNSDLVVDGIDGFVFKINEEAEFFEKLRSLILSSKTRARLGEAGRQKIYKFYTIEVRVRNMERIYLEHATIGRNNHREVL